MSLTVHCDFEIPKYMTIYMFRLDAFDIIESIKPNSTLSTNNIHLTHENLLKDDEIIYRLNGFKAMTYNDVYNYLFIERHFIEKSIDLYKRFTNLSKSEQRIINNAVRKTTRNLDPLSNNVNQFIRVVCLSNDACITPLEIWSIYYSLIKECDDEQVNSILGFESLSQLREYFNIPTFGIVQTFEGCLASDLSKHCSIHYFLLSLSYISLEHANESYNESTEQ